ncbi:hypothetical protein, partial [Mesorhizobium sp.]
MAKKKIESEFRLSPTLALQPLDTEHARRELSEIADAAEEEGLSRLAGFLAGEGPPLDLLAAVFDLSPFLRDVARRRPAILDTLFDGTIEARL